jgi:hypothetical protein
MQLIWHPQPPPTLPTITVLIASFSMFSKVILDLLFVPEFDKPVSTYPKSLLCKLLRCHKWERDSTLSLVCPMILPFEVPHSWVNRSSLLTSTNCNRCLTEVLFTLGKSVIAISKPRNCSKLLVVVVLASGATPRSTTGHDCSHCISAKDTLDVLKAHFSCLHCFFVLNS